MLLSIGACLVFAASTEHIRARSHSSEGKYPQWQNAANVAKKKPFWICNACSGTALQQFCCRVGYVLEAGLVSRLELVLFFQLLCSWRYKCGYVSNSRICDVTLAADHVIRFTRPSGSVFAYCKRSKTRAGEGLGTRLLYYLIVVFPHCLTLQNLGHFLQVERGFTKGFFCL